MTTQNFRVATYVPEQMPLTDNEVIHAKGLAVPGEKPVATVFEIPVGGPGGGIPEAPQDGTPYNRQDAGWVPGISPTTYVQKSGDTLTGALTLGSNTLADHLKLKRALDEADLTISGGEVYWLLNGEGVARFAEGGPDLSTQTSQLTVMTAEKGDYRFLREAGVWQAGTYTRNQMVRDNEYSFVCIVDDTTERPDDGNNPPTPTDWMLLGTTTGSGGGIGDAPFDSTPYHRQDGAWISSIIDAPLDGQSYARNNGDWVSAVEDAPADGNKYVRSSNAWVPSFDEAPQDSTPYNRQNGTWTQAVGEAPVDGNPYTRADGAWVQHYSDAPSDGSSYVRKNAAWEAITFTEAPADSTPYGRQDGAWTAVVPEAANDALTYGRAGLAWAAVPAEAPVDGTAYSRQDAGWVTSPPGPAGPPIPINIYDAPPGSYPAGELNLVRQSP